MPHSYTTPTLLAQQIIGEMRWEARCGCAMWKACMARCAPGTGCALQKVAMLLQLETTTDARPGSVSKPIIHAYTTPSRTPWLGPNHALINDGDVSQPSSFFNLPALMHGSVNLCIWVFLMGLFALCVDRIVARTQLLGRNTMQFFVQNSVHRLLATTTSMVPVIISVNSIFARQTSVQVLETSVLSFFFFQRRDFIT